MIPRDAETTFAERGWVAIDVPDPSGIFEARDALLAHLQRSIPALARLDDYHHHVTDRERHVEVMYDLAQFYWAAGLGRPIITRNLELFRRLIGPDLVIQSRPYLRSVRPGMDVDAAPLHRDTYYGASPYEISVVVALTRIESNAALRVISGSHTRARFRLSVCPDRERRRRHPVAQAQARLPVCTAAARPLADGER